MDTKNIVSYSWCDVSVPGKPFNIRFMSLWIFFYWIWYVTIITDGRGVNDLFSSKIILTKNSTNATLVSTIYPVLLNFSLLLTKKANKNDKNDKT